MTVVLGHLGSVQNPPELSQLMQSRDQSLDNALMTLWIHLALALPLTSSLPFPNPFYFSFSGSQVSLITHWSVPVSEPLPCCGSAVHMSGFLLYGSTHLSLPGTLPNQPCKYHHTHFSLTRLSLPSFLVSLHSGYLSPSHTHIVFVC